MLCWSNRRLLQFNARMRHLTDDILLSVKDVVRNLRYAIRSEAGPALTAARGDIGPRGAPDRSTPRKARRRHRLAKFVDRLFTEVESDALGLVSPRRERLHDAIFPRPVTAYFAGLHRHDDEAAERLFARAHYHAAKALLRGYGLDNVLIFEHAIDRARDALLGQHADLVASACDLSVSPADAKARADWVQLSAALTCALVAARPIKEIDPRRGASATPRNLIASPNAWCFVATGLSTAIASLQEESASPATSAEIVESACAITDMRFARFSAALEAGDPVDALTAEFNEVLPFLP
jgi:hypothetical protein